MRPVLALRFIKNWIVGLRNARVLIGLAAMGYRPLLYSWRFFDLNARSYWLFLDHVLLGLQIENCSPFQPQKGVNKKSPPLGI